MTIPKLNDVVVLHIFLPGKGKVGKYCYLDIWKLLKWIYYSWVTKRELLCGPSGFHIKSVVQKWIVALYKLKVGKSRQNMSEFTVSNYHQDYFGRKDPVLFRRLSENSSFFMTWKLANPIGGRNTELHLWPGYALSLSWWGPCTRNPTWCQTFSHMEDRDAFLWASNNTFILEDSLISTSQCLLWPLVQSSYTGDMSIGMSLLSQLVSLRCWHTLVICPTQYQPFEHRINLWWTEKFIAKDCKEPVQGLGMSLRSQVHEFCKVSPSCSK